MNINVIEQMVSALTAESVIPNTLFHYNKAVKVLREKVWTNKIALVWSTEDIQSFVSESCHHLELSDEEAQLVLDSLKRGYDCYIGLNWNVIEEVVEYMLADGQIKGEQ